MAAYRFGAPREQLSCMKHFVAIRRVHATLAAWCISTQTADAHVWIVADVMQSFTVLDRILAKIDLEGL